MRQRAFRDSANNQAAVIVQAEHARAVENIESIVRVPGIDAVLLGPYNLSASLGHMGQLDHPSVVHAIEHITQACQAARIPLGYFGLERRLAALDFLINDARPPFRDRRGGRPRSEFGPGWRPPPPGESGDGSAEPAPPNSTA